MVTQHNKQQCTKIREYVTDKENNMMTVAVGDDDDATLRNMMTGQQKRNT